jgi:hypothetical protein
MTTQNYLIVENNVVINVCLWDGNVNTWTPPANTTMLVQATTPALIWKQSEPLTTPITYSLEEQLGAGDIGFTWNGSLLTTNLPEPTFD